MCSFCSVHRCTHFSHAFFVIESHKAKCFCPLSCVPFVTFVLSSMCMPAPVSPRLQVATVGYICGLQCAWLTQYVHCFLFSLFYLLQGAEDRYAFGRIRGYYVGYKPYNSNQAFIYKTLQVTERGDEFRAETVLKGLARSTKYEIVLQAYNTKGAGPTSEPVFVETYHEGEFYGNFTHSVDICVWMRHESACER